jgi:acyl-CoA thioesterase II
MGDFATITSVAGARGAYRATLHPDWQVWGPVGGHVAAVALRAMAADSPLPRPASFHCLFLSVAKFGAVDLAVETLRQGQRSHALSVRVTQEGRPILAATGWMVADSMRGLEHEDVAMPPVPSPDALRGYAELADNYADWYPVWRRIEGRPVRWSEEPGPPIWHAWLRLVDTPDLTDRTLDAARSLLWMDLMMWNAATPPHPWPLSHLAPNLDLSVLFHEAAPRDEWLLCDSHAPLAREGLVGCTGRLWSPSGRLVASGTSHLFCRPNPQP